MSLPAPALDTLRTIRTRVLPWVRAHRLRLLVLFACVLAPLWLFGELADEVIERESVVFDDPVLLFLRRHATPPRDRVMLAFSLAGGRHGLVPFSVLVSLVLLVRRRWGDALFWVVAVGGSALLNLAAKQLFGRGRPALWESIAPEKSLSFPSGHAMGSMSVAAAVVVLAWPTRWRWPAMVLGGLFVLFVGTSRMYLGVHYPSDILAGWSAAFLWVIGVSAVLYGRAAKPSMNAEPTGAEPGPSR